MYLLDILSRPQSFVILLIKLDTLSTPISQMSKTLMFPSAGNDYWIDHWYCAIFATWLFLKNFNISYLEIHLWNLVSHANICSDLNLNRIFLFYSFKMYLLISLIIYACNTNFILVHIFILHSKRIIRPLYKKYYYFI